MKEQIAKIHQEASALDLHSAIADQPKAKALSAKNFCAIYKTGAIRPALMIGISLTRLFRHGKVADGIAQAVAFLDLTCGGGGA